MYIDNENFDKWMERLSKKLSEIGQDLKSLINTDKVPVSYTHLTLPTKLEV